MNDDRQLNRGPRAPLGASSVLILAATASASASFSLRRGMRLSDQLAMAGLLRRGVGQLIHQRT